MPAGEVGERRHEESGMAARRAGGTKRGGRACQQQSSVSSGGLPLKRNPTKECLVSSPTRAPHTRQRPRTRVRTHNSGSTTPAVPRIAECLQLPHPRAGGPSSLLSLIIFNVRHRRACGRWRRCGQGNAQGCAGGQRMVTRAQFPLSHPSRAVRQIELMGQHEATGLW